MYRKVILFTGEFEEIPDNSEHPFFTSGYDDKYTGHEFIVSTRITEIESVFFMAIFCQNLDHKPAKHN